LGIRTVEIEVSNFGRLRFKVKQLESSWVMRWKHEEGDETVIREKTRERLQIPAGSIVGLERERRERDVRVKEIYALINQNQGIFLDRCGPRAERLTTEVKKFYISRNIS
jgi:hypothetical protein